METQFIPTWAVSVLLLLLAIAVSVWALKSAADADLDDTYCDLDENCIGGRHSMADPCKYPRWGNDR